MTDNQEEKQENESLPEDERNETEVEESLAEENERLKQELKKKNDQYLMALAEAENARKRIYKERQDLLRLAVENILVEILTPIENMENALKFAKDSSDEVKNWALGFEMILNQFKQILTDHGITEYTSAGKIFDPFLHEAIEIIETDDYPDGTVVEELSKGYKADNKPIRVARVKVAKTLKVDTNN
ncbi:MAG: nucleotide exchange factor GrpE [Victivallaceae bacterium]